MDARSRSGTGRAKWNGVDGPGGLGWGMDCDDVSFKMGQRQASMVRSKASFVV